LSVLAKNWLSNFFTRSLFSLNSLNKFYKIQINSVKSKKIDNWLCIFFLILRNFNNIFHHYNPPLSTIQPKWLYKRNITCTNNASSSSSSLSQIIITIPHYSLPFSLLSYTSLLSLYLDWKPGPRYKEDSTLQLWCRAWSVWLSSGLLSQKNSFLEQYCGSIPVNSSIINLVLEVHCDLYMHRIDNCSLREGSRVGVSFLGTIVYLFS